MKQIELSKGLFAKVDDDDFEKLSAIKWCAVKNRNKWYALNGKGKSKIWMHRYIMFCENSKLFVDHIDGDGLNNQKENLRISDASQNGANRKMWDNKSSKFLGVYKARKKYRAAARKDGVLYVAGLFETEEAAIAYNNLAKTLHGSFAKLNNV